MFLYFILVKFSFIFRFNFSVFSRMWDRRLIPFFSKIMSSFRSLIEKSMLSSTVISLSNLVISLAPFNFFTFCVWKYYILKNYCTSFWQHEKLQFLIELIIHVENLQLLQELKRLNYFTNCFLILIALRSKKWDIIGTKEAPFSYLDLGLSLS